MASSFLVGLVGLLGAWGYALFLQSIHETYAPDFIWVTVVVGNGLVGLCFVGLLVTLGVFSWAVVVCFVVANVVCGLPIIGWQLVQAKRRRNERES